MDIENFNENKKAIAFSDKTIEESFNRIVSYKGTNLSTSFSLQELTEKVDPDLLKGLEDMLEETSSESVEANKSDHYISNFTDDIYDKVSNWAYKLKEILNVTLVKKILDNFEFVTENMNKKLLESIYIGNHTDDLLYIWFSTFREKLRNQEQK